MEAKQWTKEQEQAIKARGSNLLVAAAAGSGKTAVLIERIIRLIIDDRVDIRNLLVVTFTNAAAGEMRERLGEAIIKELDKAESGKNAEHLRNQLNQLSKASISTLHSFCIDVLRSYFYLLDIDPNFKIADSTEISLLKIKLVEEMFEAEYTEGNELFLGLVERFGGNREDKPLQNLVLELYDFIQSKPYPLQWLAEKVEDFSLDIDGFGQTAWASNLTQAIRLELAGAKELINEAIKVSRLPEGPFVYLANLENDLQLITQLEERLIEGLASFYQEIVELQFTKLSRASKELDEELKQEVKDLRDESKKLIGNIQKVIFARSPEEYIEDLQELYPYMQYLSRLIAGFTEEFTAKKLERGILDFNDLEHYALAVLENEQVSEEYRRQFQYIFIDEYQDSNIVQETIISRIKRADNLFMVGDVKQSIYRFRLADPSLFIAKYQSFRAAPDSLNRRIDLNKNFRSRAEVINGVNFLFKQLMTSELGEISYDASAYLYRGAQTEDFANPEIEVNIIEKNGEELSLASEGELNADAEHETAEQSDIEQEEEGNSINPELLTMEHVEAEARLTASRIKSLLTSQLYDNKLKQYRQVEYQDIVVLLRTTKGWAETFKQVFIEENIPTYADVNAGFFTSTEINILMNLLRVIDNKRQDLPLISLMRSPIGGLTINELIEIRLSAENTSFYGAALAYLQNGEESLKTKLDSFFNKVKKWQEEARYLPLADFIWKLMIETGYYIYVGAMPGGIQRQANLRMLVDRAKQYQKSSIKGLFNFIKFIEQLESTSHDMGTAKTLGENDNVVRIMSIHKSKGLEFPIVIIAGMGKQFNLNDARKSILFHKDLGIGPTYVSLEYRQYYDTIAKSAMKHRIKLESLSEEMRILYVALTRAKDKLILVGSINSLEKSIKKWQKKLTSFNLLKGKSYYDWILPVVLRHQANEDLRETTTVDLGGEELLTDESMWQVKFMSKESLVLEQGNKPKAQEELEQLLSRSEEVMNTEEWEFVAKRLGWQYANSQAVLIPSKLSVTDIKKLATKELAAININIPSLVKKPRFMEGEREFTAVEKGTIIHFIMQHLNLHKATSLEQIEEQIGQMVANELILPEEAAVVEPEKLWKLFNSPLGQRILQTDQIYREVPFNYVKEAKAVIPGITTAEDKLLIQGVIDLYFVEDGEFVLVDYKTDHVDYDREEELVERYQVQMKLYKEALEQITGGRVKESYLYLFHLDKEVAL